MRVLICSLPLLLAAGEPAASATPASPALTAASAAAAQTALETYRRELSPSTAERTELELTRLAVLRGETALIMARERPQSDELLLSLFDQYHEARRRSASASAEARRKQATDFADIDRRIRQLGLDVLTFANSRGQKAPGDAPAPR